MLSMKKKILVLSVFSLALLGGAFAQQDRAMTHSMYDKMSVNPGSTGIEDGICGTLLYRNQWDKFNGAPNSVVFNVEANLDRFINSGIGISFFHDAIGFNRQNNLLLNYSYHLNLGNAGTLGMGLGLGIVNFSMAPTWVTPQTDVDNILPTAFSGTNFDMNFGLYFKGSKNYYVGISSTHLTQSIISDPALNQINFNTDRHYYLMGGYRLDGLFGSNNEFDLDLNTLMRTEFRKFSADITARVFWNKLLYGGLGYRTGESVLVLLGASMKLGPGTGSFGYSYDITTNKYIKPSWGTHEIMMRYCYIIPPPPITKSAHPRWL